MAETAELRDILLHTDVKRPCCAAAELSGMLTADGNIYSSVDKAVSGRLLFLKKKAGNVTQTGDECCRKAFLKGALEIKGTASSADSKAPYIEVRFHDSDSAEKYKQIADTFGIKSGISKRRGEYVFYIKNAQGISDFLLLSEAPGLALRFMVSKTEREVTNDINRAMNCDMANISRNAEKYNTEYEFVSELSRDGRINRLPEKLKQTAELRLNNPGANYSELGEMSSPVCSKSTISLRMKSILEYFGHKTAKYKK